MMLKLKRARAERCPTNGNDGGDMSVVITLDQTVFKRELMNVFTDKFITSQPMKKRVHVTQLKCFPKLDKCVPFGVTFPIGWS